MRKASGGRCGAPELSSSCDGEACRLCPLGKPDRLRYAVSERMFGVRTEMGAGELLLVEPAGSHACLARIGHGEYRMDLLDRLLEHDYWATTQLLELSRDLTDAQLDQPFDIGHRTLRATFDHTIFNTAAWTRRMAEQPIDVPRDDLSMAALIERHERSYADFVAFARRIRDEQRMDDTFVDYFGGEMTYGGAIIHVVLHNAEHRSEALHILARLGVPDLPEVDHGLWDFERRGF